ncbi:protein CHAPERONE-LIKE PROTEIN OF POR1, chloroplastic-like [Phalaenopsis equestris]|uniref:protein CHAPERONE-LIKE PROTEIN OF POR1, chloroplastic-like n=1 Tax=Phalaenopsis equestris TaxID=78828 RepID=UPI0009E4799B|nr:protein CHAPERONE-LIKE PROTEIN OF POR1, chloroplastic-like [Phalaenopsis equestris]
MDSLLLIKSVNFPSRPLLNPKSSKQKEARRARRLGSRSPSCSMGVALGGSNDYENVMKFPRMHVWDPFKRLGLTRDASQEEILAARNYLLEQYAGHEASVESIEGAFEKLLMASFRLRKKTKINLKSRLKKQVEESPPWVQRLLAYVEVPPVDTILRRLFLFAFMGGWSIMNSAETGPAFQVALSLGSCIYFLNDKMKNVPRAAITGFAALAVGWIVGSIVVPLIPSVLLQPSWSLELFTSLFCYFFLFVACTLLK